MKKALGFVIYRSMQARQRTILVFLHVFSWLFLCSAGRSFAFDNRNVDSLQQALLKHQPDTIRIKTLLKLSAAYERDSLPTSFYYANEALFQSEKKKWQKGISSAELRIAICYVNVWELQEAIRHLQKSIKAAQVTGDKHTERACWQYLVHCYDSRNEHQKAFDCQDHLMTMIYETKDTVAICRQMSAYATVMAETGRKQEGINWLNKDILIAGAHIHGNIQRVVLSELFNTLSIEYHKMHKIDSMFFVLRKALPLVLAINDTVDIAYLYSTLSYAHSEINAHDSAEFYAGQTITLAEYMKDLPLLKNTHNELAEIYERLGQPAKALIHYKTADSIAQVITDSEKTLEQSMQISRVAIEQQRIHREQEKKDLEAVNADQKKALIIAIGIVVALGIIIALVFRNLRVKAKTNKIIRAQAEGLKQQNEVIDAALHDKEILLQEMHHRVKNNLQLMNGLLELQIAKLTDKKSVDALMVTQQRIYSMAMVHSKLYHNSADASIEVREFASDLFQSLSNAFSENESNVQLENHIAETHLSLNMLVPLGLILNELITNSFKHAFRNTEAGTITLKLRQENESVILAYTDNGEGIDAGQFNEDSGTLGIYLVKRLTRQLKGDMVYHKENGSTFTFTFPL